MLKNPFWLIALLTILMLAACENSSYFNGPRMNLPVTSATQLSGSWVFEKGTVNGLDFSRQTFINNTKTMALESLSGTVEFTPTSETSGVLSFSEYSTLSNQSLTEDKLIHSTIKNGRFTIVSPGVVSIVLSSGNKGSVSDREFIGEFALSSGILFVYYTHNSKHVVLSAAPDDGDTGPVVNITGRFRRQLISD